MCDLCKLTPEEREKRINKTVDKLVEYFRNEHLKGAVQKKEIEPPRFKFPWEFSKDQNQDLERLFLKREEKGKTGRPKNNLIEVLSGIFWYLSNEEVTWSNLPSSFPPHQTCHRYFKKWKENGVLNLAIVLTDFEPKRGF